MTMRVITGLALAIGTWGPMTAHAQNVPMQASQAPEAYVAQDTQGCTAFRTYQLRNCAVISHYTCADGTFRMISAIQNQLVAAERFSADLAQATWVGLDGPGHTKTASVIDPLDIVQLRQTNRERSETMLSADVGYYQGTVRSTEDLILTGQAVSDAGEVYLVGRSARRVYMPAPYGVFELDYVIYLARDFDLIVPSLERMAFAGETETYPTGLMQVHRPGSPGFLTRAGLFDCGVVQ